MKQQPTTTTAPATAPDAIEPGRVDIVGTNEEEIAAIRAAANAIVTQLLDAIKLALSRAPYDELKAPLHAARRAAGAYLGVDEK